MSFNNADDDELDLAPERFMQRSRAAAVYDLAARRARDTLADRNRELEEQNRQLEITVRRLRKLAYVDALTGLANRRHFEFALHSEVRRARRAGASIAVALCDVDHFKRFNDTHGHPAGDMVLELLGATLREHCRRAGDLSARYGGEEFALLLPGTAGSEAMGIAERVRDSVAQLALPGSCGAGRVTVSIGVAAFSSHTPRGPSELVHAADSALYAAKAAGRNCVCYAAG